MTPDALDQAALAAGLRLRGLFAPDPDAVLPDGTETLVLLGPDEPRFWPLFAASDEYRTRVADPMDAWSKRVIGALARDWGGSAIFPSDGPPWPPFIKWATDCAEAWEAPVGLLVHHHAGLFLSFRGAIALPFTVTRPDTFQRPCDTCTDQPCVTACPVGAMAPGQPYDVPRCKTYLRTDAGQNCRENGCLVRRACPVSQEFTRHPEQAAFHMRAFLGN